MLIEDWIVVEDRREYLQGNISIKICTILVSIFLLFLMGLVKKRSLKLLKS